MANIAIYISGVSKLQGGGGVERFFSLFFKLYIGQENKKHNLYLFTDKMSFENLSELGLIHNKTNVVLLKTYSNRFKDVLEKRDIQKKIKKYKINIFHCANFNVHDHSRLSFIRDGFGHQVKIVMNIVDCRIPYILEDPNDERREGYFKRFIQLPEQVEVDGIYSWYINFLDYIKDKKLIPSGFLPGNIVTRFADVEKFFPAEEKENIIVFASRLDDQKRPLLFLEAINHVSKTTDLFDNWQIKLFGKGPLEDKIKEFIERNGLKDRIQMGVTADMSPEFRNSKLYVSTQMYENFPSLSMMEAMASGNAVIAFNVGQSELMVEHGKNGFLCEEENETSLAEAIIQFLSLEKKDQEIMQEASFKMVKEKHTFESFKDQIEEYWEKLLVT